jgi:hypothetical protein
MEHLKIFRFSRLSSSGRCALTEIMLTLLSLYFLSTAWAAPSPQGGHDHGAKGPAGVGKMADMLGKAFSGFMTPLPLSKITKAERPEFTVPGVIREQLYYGPLVLRPAAVISLFVGQKIKIYNEI